MHKPAFELSADSVRNEGVPRGAVTKFVWNSSKLYPRAEHDVSIYVPAQYSDAEPACVMVFQDGEAYVNEHGSVKASIVFDNLIHQSHMPTCIGVFVSPGTRDEPYDLRADQYVPINDTYASYLEDEILAEVSKTYRLVEDASGRAICGMSDGGLCAFTVGWHRPDLFSKVVSHIGSFTRLRGGSDYPYHIRRTRGEPKPLRVFLQDGKYDVNLMEGNWTLANLMMADALRYARYDYRFELGEGGHDLQHGGALFPETLRWLWRDYPGVSNGYVHSDPSLVVGTWKLESRFFGERHYGTLVLEETDGQLQAELHHEHDGQIEVLELWFRDSYLSFSYRTPATQLRWGKGDDKVMTTWLKVDGDRFEGVLSGSGRVWNDWPTFGTRIA
ncbi:MAG: hypothetical protein F4W90_08460 [Gammaproteobacteria bacterium]|nr:hypothetical protein [Gammaproteobacteria bacterium]